jgi:hypothetical protein
MKIFLLTLSVFFALANTLPAQTKEEKKAREILDEGLYLYHLEKSSWIASDLISEKYPDAKIEGYVSYRDGNHYTTIFYAGNGSQVIKSFRFDTTFNKKSVEIGETERAATDREKMMITLRTKAALELLAPPQLFELYDKISVNLQVLEMTGGTYRVYGIPGTTEPGYIPLGNDFMIDYDKDGKIIKREKLHTSFFPIDMNGKPLKDIGKFTPMHTHVDKFSPYITPTDICQILLFSGLYSYKYELVISENYLSILFIPQQQLKIFKIKDSEELLKYINQYCPEESTE